MQEAALFPFLFRLIRLRGGSFLQELYEFEKILTVKKSKRRYPFLRPLPL
jgi:hypothetical protein